MDKRVNHVATVRRQRLSVCDARVVAGDVGYDTLTLDLDREWDGLSCVVAFGEGDGQVLVGYGGEPVEIPRSLIAEPGWLAVSIVGYGQDGRPRAVTEASPMAMVVVEGGSVPDNPYPEEPDLLGQLVSAGNAATEAAGAANSAAQSATEAVGAANAAASSASSAAQSASAAAERANSAASDAESAAIAAGEKSFYAYPYPPDPGCCVIEYPAFLEYAGGKGVYIYLDEEES